MKNLGLLPLFLLIFLVTTFFSQQNPTLPINTEVILNINVTDYYGKPVIGLEKETFTVTSDKEVLEITSFLTNEPAEVYFLFDKSKGMSNLYQKLGTGKQSFIYELVSGFMKTSNALNNYSLVAYNKTQEPLLISTNSQTDVLSAIEKLDVLKLEGPTTYVDACYFGLEKISLSKMKKRALILFTNGNDTKSNYTSKQLLKVLKENNVMLYTIAIIEHPSIADLGTFVANGPPQRIGTTRGIYIPSDKNLELMSKFDEMAKLTEISGGKSFFPRSATEIAEIFSRLGNELRFQYTLEVKLNNTSSNKQPHRLKVKVKPPRGAPSVFVRNREEFFVD